MKYIPAKDEGQGMNDYYHANEPKFRERGWGHKPQSQQNIETPCLVLLNLKISARMERCYSCGL